MPDFFDMTPGDYDITYWRKMYGLRRDIKADLHIDPDEYEYLLDAEEIDHIVKILWNYTDEEYWRENGDTFWEYREVIGNLVQSIMNLKWLAWYKRNHPEVEVYFYDSY